MRSPLLTLALVGLLSSLGQGTPITTSQELLEVTEPDHVSEPIVRIDNALRTASPSSEQESHSGLCRRNDPPQEASWSDSIADFFGFRSYAIKGVIKTIPIKPQSTRPTRRSFVFTQPFQPERSYLIEVHAGVSFAMRVMGSRNGNWVEGPAYQPFLANEYGSVPVAVHEPVQIMLVIQFASTGATGELRLSEVTPNYDLLYQQRDLAWPFGVIAAPRAQVGAPAVQAPAAAAPAAASAAPASAPAAAPPTGGPSPVVGSPSRQANDTWGPFEEWSDDRQ